MTGTGPSFGDIQGPVLVIGVGRSGMAAADVLRGGGLRVLAYDDTPPEERSSQKDRLARLGVTLIPRERLALTPLSAAVVSPGVPLDSFAVRQMRKAGVPVYSEIEVAYRLSRAPIIAVTGTKGKSTTTALIGHILRCAGRRVRVGGNIGNPLIGQTKDAEPDEWVVAEVSSFQLDAIDRFEPRISVMTNVSADHLDRYSSMDDYRESKFRIFENQKPDGIFIGNADDAIVSRLRTDLKGRLKCGALWFARRETPGVSMWLQEGAMFWQSGCGQDPARELLSSISQTRLRGSHNAANAMAASLAALCAGVDPAMVGDALRSFEPLPHRLSEVPTSDGITWIDDSKATNPQAVIEALDSFEAPLILIAGGKGKKSDFARLGKAISGRAKMLVLIGECAPQIAAHVEGPEVARARDLGEAVEVAAANAKIGDVILLSPGAASFDMFESAEQRGEIFTSLVKQRAVCT